MHNTHAYIAAIKPSVSDWGVQVPSWRSGLGVGLCNRWPGIDPRKVRYIGGNDNLGSPEWKLPTLVESRGGGGNVTNHPSVSDWVVQVTFVAPFRRWTVRYMYICIFRGK